MQLRFYVHVWNLWLRESVIYMCFFNINPQDASCLFNFSSPPLSLACLTWPSFVWEFKKEYDWLPRWLAVDKDHDISFARIHG